MHTEVKNLCKAKQWREAIELVLRMKPEVGTERIQDLLAISAGVIQHIPKGEKRDVLLVPIIQAFLQLDDIEHPRECLLALYSEQYQHAFVGTIRDVLLLRLSNSVYGVN